MYCFLPVVPPLLVSGPPPQESMIPVLSSRGWGEMSAAASSFSPFLPWAYLARSSCVSPPSAVHSVLPSHASMPFGFMGVLHPPSILPSLSSFSFLFYPVGPTFLSLLFFLLFPLPCPSIRPSGPFNCARKQNRPFDRPTKNKREELARKALPLLSEGTEMKYAHSFPPFLRSRDVLNRLQFPHIS